MLKSRQWVQCSMCSNICFLKEIFLKHNILHWKSKKLEVEVEVLSQFSLCLRTQMNQPKTWYNVSLGKQSSRSHGNIFFVFLSIFITNSVSSYIMLLSYKESKPFELIYRNIGNLYSYRIKVLCYSYHLLKGMI